VRIDPGRTFVVTQPGDKERMFVGPTLHWEVHGPADFSAHEFRAIYTGALERTGWKILHSGGGLSSAGDYNVLAHYAQRGRDLWMYADINGNAASFIAADVGAQAAAARLKQALERDGHIAVYGIYFDIDKATIKSESEATLQQILDLLKSNPSLALRIEGHTDNTGTHEHNQPLSEQRAASVKAWLVERAVAASRLATAGYAETHPVGDNKTPQGRSLNRRVELAKP
jgi:outer membrane protein OmpA-like peptidoglycan-associated protein